MTTDPISESLFEMRLEEIHSQDAWLRYQITLRDFTALFFPLHYKDGKPLRPELPADGAIDREIYLKVLVAFKQTFN